MNIKQYIERKETAIPVLAVVLFFIFSIALIVKDCNKSKHTPATIPEKTIQQVPVKDAAMQRTVDSLQAIISKMETVAKRQADTTGQLRRKLAASQGKVRYIISKAVDTSDYTKDLTASVTEANNDCNEVIDSYEKQVSTLMDIQANKDSLLSVKDNQRENLQNGLDASAIIMQQQRDNIAKLNKDLKKSKNWGTVKTFLIVAAAVKILTSIIK